VVDAPGQDSDRFQFLGLDEFLLHFPLTRLVPKNQ